MIIDICQDIVEGWLDLDLVGQLSYEEAKQYLMQFNGIGPKVADCICLYGYHYLQAFPVDTHIEQILERDYNCDCETFKKRHLSKLLQNYGGVIQQYMFYNETNPPEEVKT